MAGAAIILLLGMAVRLTGINFGLPYLYHPDEPVNIGIIQTIFINSDPDPHFYTYPAPFFYLHALSYFPYYYTGKVSGAFQSRMDIVSPSMINMGVGITPLPGSVLLGRLITAFFSGLIILTGFLAVRQVTGKVIPSLAGGLALAASPILAAQGRYLTPDTPLTAFLLLTLLFSIRIYQRQKTADYWLAAAACSLAASMKLTGLFGLPVIAAAHFLKLGWPGLKDRRLYLAAVLILSVTAFGNYFILKDIVQNSLQVLNTLNHYAAGTGGDTSAGTGNSALFYLKSLALEEGPLIFAALTSLFLIFSRKARSRGWRDILVILYAFLVPYSLVISLMSARNIRTLLPVIPFAWIAAVLAITGILETAGISLRSPRWYLPWMLLALIGFGYPLSRSTVQAVNLAKYDSRETAREWITTSLPAGATIALEAYSPYLDPGQFNLVATGRIIDHTPGWYRENQVAYIVFSQSMFMRYFREPERYPDEVNQYSWFFDNLHLVKEFTDGGYVVKVLETGYAAGP